MANAVFPKFKQELLKGTSGTSLNGSGSTGVYAALVDTGVYTYSSAHQYYSDLGASVVGTPVELSSKTFTSGLFDAADATWSAVSGSSAEAIVLYVKNGGANTTWPLVAYIDSGATGLPVTPSGADINVVWNASGIIQF